MDDCRLLCMCVFVCICEYTYACTQVCVCEVDDELYIKPYMYIYINVYAQLLCAKCGK